MAPQRGAEFRTINISYKAAPILFPRGEEERSRSGSVFFEINQVFLVIGFFEKDIRLYCELR